MAVTKRTEEEAKKYIIDSLEEWKSNDQGRKIISLSNMIEQWRSNKGKTLKKIRAIKKSIKDIERIIHRHQIINPTTNVKVLEDELLRFKEAYDGMVKKYGEPPQTKKRQNKDSDLTGDTN